MSSAFPAAEPPTPFSPAPFSSAAPSIVARGVRKSYVGGDGTPLQVLDGVDLEVRPGEMVSVIGQSGSGKSTLLHVLGALDHADAGEVFVGGRHVAALKEEALAELRGRNVGFVFQFHHLLREFSALENVMMPHLIRLGIRAYLGHRRRLRAEATALLERVGLGHRLEHRPAELSGGEMQRAAIARALAGGPAIVLADEPTGNLDAATGRGVLELLRDLNRERGLTMILVTHDPQIAQQADRIVRLAEGRIEEWVPALA